MRGSTVVASVIAVLACSGTPAAREETSGAETASVPASVSVPLYTADIVATFPHSPDAFTQGLELHGGRLYESTGLIGHSSLRIVDLDSGRLEQMRALAPELYAEGLTVLEGRVYQLTYQSERCLVSDAATLAPIGEHRYPGEGWGLTHHDGALIVSDGTSVLRFLDPETFALRHTLAVLDGATPIDQLNELEMVEGELFANVWMSDRIARIDLATGAVTGWIDLAFLRAQLGLTERQAVLNGIAYDAEAHRLFVTGKLWPALYEIRLRRTE